MGNNLVAHGLRLMFDGKHSIKNDYGSGLWLSEIRNRCAASPPGSGPLLRFLCFLHSRGLVIKLGPKRIRLEGPMGQDRHRGQERRQSRGFRSGGRSNSQRSACGL